MAKTVKHDENGRAYWGNEEHLNVLNRSFTTMIFDLLLERVPHKEEEKLFNLILNISIDHGPNTPSAKPVIEAAQKGLDLSEALSEGIKEINDVHGGAMTPLMEVIYKIKDGKLSVVDLVTQSLKEHQKLPGFGHRIYKDKDPRAELILSETDNLLGSNPYTTIVEEIRSELNSQNGKGLPINIDGAIAAALCALGFEPRAGKAVFLIARTPGLIAHFLNNS